MATFKDKTGQSWDVEITVGHIKPLREQFGVDLKEVLKDWMGKFGELISDPHKLYDLLLLLCDDQIEKRKLDAEQFAKLLSPAAMRDAAAAVAGCAWDFCQGPTMAQKASESIRAAMNESDVYLANELQKESTALISKLFAGSSPESSASPTQGQELSAN